MEAATDFELRKFFIEYLDKTMEITMSHPDYDINKDNYHLHSENGKLAFIILKYTSKLKDLLSDLKKVEVFMRRFPNKNFYKENDIDELDYIKYHYEVFLHKVHTILELKKLAINKFYKIGLHEKDCNWKNLKNQPKLENKPTLKIVEYYFNSFEHLIEHRNLNTHRALFFDKKNEELKLDSFIYSNYEKQGEEVSEEFRKMMPPQVLKYFIKEYKKEKIKYVKEAIEIANTYIEKFETIILTDFFIIIMNEKDKKK